jgi:hypothetical protein
MRLGGRLVVLALEMFCNVLGGSGRRLILGNRRACVSPGRWLVRLRRFSWWPNGSGEFPSVFFHDFFFVEVYFGQQLCT